MIDGDDGQAIADRNNAAVSTRGRAPPDRMLTVAGVLALARELGCRQPAQVRRLIQDRFQISLEQQFAHPGTEIAGTASLIVMLRDLAADVPLARITGEQWFYGRPFHVGASCFEPRPETETIIEAVSGFYDRSEEALTFIDMASGSGVLAVTLLALYPRSRGYATDSNPQALTDTAANARRHRVAERLTILPGNWLDPVPDQVMATCDLIVSNPPYVTAAEYRMLPPRVRNFDPVEALTEADGDGASGYRALRRRCLETSRRDKTALLVVEHGAGQHRLVSGILATPPLTAAAAWYDQARLPRVFAAFWHPACPVA